MIDPQPAICHPTGPCSSHFSATLVLFLDPNPHPHLAESPWLQAWFTAPAQHSLDTKLPGLLGLHDFYCTTLHHTPNPDGVLHNIWWYRICQQVEIGIIGLCWALWVWSVLTGSVPETKLEGLDIIDMHIKPWHFGPPTKLWALLFLLRFKNVAVVVENVERGTIPHSPAPLEFRSLIETSLLNFYES